MKIDRLFLENLFLDGESGYEYLPRIRGITTNRQQNETQKQPGTRNINSDLSDQFDTLREYEFTYAASRHEKWWLLESLGLFFDEQWFDDVLKTIKGGKEASVYLCQANTSADMQLLAAKVYRPRSLRNLRKDHLYREGRLRLDADGLQIIDERQSRAIHNRTSYGQNLMHTSWIEHEFRTLKILHKAGCDVPEPVASDHNAILMEYIGDTNIGAPTLNGIRLNKSDAYRLFDQVLHNIELMLQSNRVHGDLSAYNILYWDGEITFIDFPQAINPNRNPNTYTIFQRDVHRICEYFISQGVYSDPEDLSEDLWTKYGFSTIPNILWEEPVDE